MRVARIARMMIWKLYASDNVCNIIVLVGTRSSFMECVLVEQDVISVLSVQYQYLNAREGVHVL